MEHMNNEVPADKMGHEYYVRSKRHLHAIELADSTKYIANIGFRYPQC